MDEQALRQLIEISHAVGVRPDLVQGGGGNTSVKSSDGKTMFIKGSGTTLGAMSEQAGWVELDLAEVLSMFDDGGLATLAAQEREMQVLRLLQQTKVRGPSERPSVESSLHAMLGKVVIHTHPTAINALTCGPGQAALPQLVKPGEPTPLWVAYTDPGYTLAVTVSKAVVDYRKRFGHGPEVLLLENHGIFVSAETPKECLAIHSDWVARCEAYFEKSAPALNPKPAVDTALLRKMMAVIRRICRKRNKGPVFARLSSDVELTNAACDRVIANTLAGGALSPDQIVYCGSCAIYAANAAEAASAIEFTLDQPAAPRVVLLKDTGALLVSDDPGKLGVIEATASSAARTIRLALGRGGAHNLGSDSAQFIIGWEVEHYRAKQLDKAAGRLRGKVAVVTGGASGLGLGIALGLMEAGAAVAFCDIDEPGLKAVTSAANPPDRALPVKMNVMDENAVRDAFDRVVQHWGGVDIVVCAAGIAPPFNLVDMPLDKWRLALEINLTGYFLVAREGARIMQGQGQGGSMVMISSKSGLDASKANSAYNATKAGELHLMRGWALELGPDGIRCNAVAPGNVFEGSKIWNPEYIKACAKKKGIQPEEVIPYYVSLTALNREIKRNDIANAVVFLCSDEARCVTGQTLVVDSGQVMVR